MTVGELIKELKRFDLDLPVLVPALKNCTYKTPYKAVIIGGSGEHYVILRDKVRKSQEIKNATGSAKS